MKPVDVTPEAESDLLAIVDRLSSWSLAGAEQFIQRFEATIERLGEFPGVGVSSLRGSAKPRRILHVDVYDFIYEEWDDRVVLVRVVDGRRLRRRP